MILVISILLIRQSVQAQLVQETVQLGIDNLIEMLLGLDKTENEKIKNAAALQEL